MKLNIEFMKYFIKEKEPLISVIIINYNGEKFILETIDSVLSNNFKNSEIILFDNASKDQSLEMIKQGYRDNNKIKIIESTTNLGFAGGNNEAAKYASGNILFLLNSDAIAEKECLQSIIDFFETTPDAGIIQCKIKSRRNPELVENAGNYIDTLGVSYVMANYREDCDKYNQTKKIFTANGAAFAIRNDVFNEVGGFDSDYFLLYEESDLCWRARISGYEIYYLPKAVVYHWGSASFGIQRSRNRKKINTNSLYLFTRNRMTSLIKNYESKNLLKYLPLNILTMEGLAFYYLSNLNFGAFNAINKAILVNFLSIGRVLKKRRIVQKNRRVPDCYFFDQQYIKGFSLKRLLKKIYGKNTDE